MKRRLYILILVVFIAFLLFYIINRIIIASNEQERVAGEKIAQQNIENYLKERYSNNEMTILAVNYIDQTKEYVSTVKDENGAEFVVTINRDSKITDTYVEPIVEIELQSKLTAFVKELNGTLDLAITRVEKSIKGSNYEKPKIIVDIRLLDKGKTAITEEKGDKSFTDEERIDTKKEFAECVVLIRDEVLKLLDNDCLVEKLCIRLNTFMVEFSDTQLQYNSNEIENVVVILD